MTGRMIGGSLVSSADPCLPAELLAHLPHAEQAAFENLSHIGEVAKPELANLRCQIQELQTPKVPVPQKLIRIRHLSSEWSRIFATRTACASGCSHCCNINTAVPRNEAKLIAKAINRPLAEPTEKYGLFESSQRQDYFGVPCTFLEAGKCSIYAHRPLVCRTLVNMDSVETLCKLVPGMQVPVPYLNTSELQGYFAYFNFSEQYADMREWFPKLLPTGI